MVDPHDLPVQVLEGKEFLRVYRTVSLRYREHVRLAVEAGEAIPDPHLAMLAVGLAQQNRIQARWRRLAGVGGVFAILLGGGRFVDTPVLARVLVALGVVWQVVRDFRGRSRYDDAEAANRRVLSEHWAATKPPPAVEGSVGEALERWKDTTLGGDA